MIGVARLIAQEPDVRRIHRIDSDLVLGENGGSLATPGSDRNGEKNAKQRNAYDPTHK